jgi:hypothetical protein
MKRLGRENRAARVSGKLASRGVSPAAGEMRTGYLSLARGPEIDSEIQSGRESSKAHGKTHDASRPPSSHTRGVGWHRTPFYDLVNVMDLRGGIATSFC